MRAVLVGEGALVTSSNRGMTASFLEMSISRTGEHLAIMLSVWHRKDCALASLPGHQMQACLWKFLPPEVSPSYLASDSTSFRCAANVFSQTDWADWAGF